MSSIVVIIYWTSFQEMLERLRRVLARLREAELKLKPRKEFFWKRVHFLGHVVSKESIAPDSDTTAVEQWPVPSSVAELCSFNCTAVLAFQEDRVVLDSGVPVGV